MDYSLAGSTQFKYRYWTHMRTLALALDLTIALLLAQPETLSIENSIIGVNRPALGGTLPNLTAMSRCPALLTFYPAF